VTTVRLIDIKTRALNRADMTGSAFAVDARVTDMANAELSRVHALLVMKFEDYLVKQRQFTLATTEQKYQLPSDFLKHRDLFLLDTAGDGKREYRLERCRTFDFPMGETGWETIRDNRALKYTLQGNELWFHRKPNSADTVEQWYIPQYVWLDDDNDEISYTVPCGWEDIAVEGLTARLVEQEEQDPSPFLRRRAALVAELDMLLEGRNAGEPDRVRDAYGRFNREL
jgi:hypothetical protein